MTPTKQTKFGAGEGNCLNACLASLFDIPLENTPDFGKMRGLWVTGFLRFIKKMGHEYVGTGKPDEVAETKGYVIVCGVSPRNLMHSVIYLDGKPFHDPHPSNEFLTEVRYFYMIEKTGGALKEDD